MPKKPSLYHITHVDNLKSIIADGGLWSDAEMLKQGKINESIGMSEIKERRLILPVKCHIGDYVGDYVPLYFCPRSIMLYVIFKGNHSELAYRGGQKSIIHLETDVFDVVRWAETHGCRWAFSLSNAGASYTEFCKSIEELSEIDWEAVESRDFYDPHVKDGKQAEFLIYGFLPWNLFKRIGVYSRDIQNIVFELLGDTEYKWIIRPKMSHRSG